MEVAATGLRGLFATEEKCFASELPSLEFKNALVGGGSFNVTFERQGLASERPLKVYVLAEDVPADLEGFATIQATLSSNKDHPSFRVPEI